VFRPGTAVALLRVMQIGKPRLSSLGVLTALLLAAACDDAATTPPPATDRPTPAKPGQTSFTTEDTSMGSGSNFGGPGRGGVPTADSSGASPGGGKTATPPAPMAPGGRVGEV